MHNRLCSPSSFLLQNNSAHRVPLRAFLGIFRHASYYYDMVVCQSGFIHWKVPPSLQLLLAFALTRKFSLKRDLTLYYRCMLKSPDQDSVFTVNASVQTALVGDGCL